MSGGTFHPGALHKCCCKLQSILHHVQKGGDFLVILEDSTGQESVDHRQQSLHGGGAQHKHVQGKGDRVRLRRGGVPVAALLQIISHEFVYFMDCIS